jgi:hypothetical protein
MNRRSGAKGSAAVCIYCKSGSNRFNREHALHQAFGTYQGNQFVMHDLVCLPCNQHFGDTIDLALTRDSMEALLRFQFGIKSPSKASDIPYGRITLKMNKPGPWFGAQFEFESDALGMAWVPLALPQLALRLKNETDWKWILEKDLDDASVAPFRAATPGTLDVKILGRVAGDAERLAEKLKNLGVVFEIRGPINDLIVEGGTIDTQISSQVDSTIFRAIAKIAFNYVACVHGASFILRTDFDYLREYIRYRKELPWPPVIPTSEPILALDSRRYRQTNGHLITFDWNASGDGLLAQVSLFNLMTYRVLFCLRYRGIWSDSMRTGHHFDFEDGVISPLSAASATFTARAG